MLIRIGGGGDVWEEFGVWLVLEGAEGSTGTLIHSPVCERSCKPALPVSRKRSVILP